MHATPCVSHATVAKRGRCKLHDHVWCAFDNDEHERFDEQAGGGEGVTGL
jgi:hypothetical protein